MAASRVFSGRKLCKRYKIFFYVAFALVGMQMYLAYTFYSMSQNESMKASEWKRRVELLEEDNKLHKIVHGENENHTAINRKLSDDRLEDILAPVAQAIQGILGKKDDNKVAPKGVQSIQGSVTKTKGYHPKCTVKDPDAISALERARTDSCKQEISDTYCTYQEGKLYPASLPRYCPLKAHNGGEYVGCFKDSRDNRILDGAHHELKDNSPENCINFCLMTGAQLAGVQYIKECWCGTAVELGAKLPDDQCDSKCPGDASAHCGGFLAVSIYHTGYGEKPKNEAPLVRAADLLPDETPVRIVFVLTVNGRAVRQVHRLFKALYHVNHYFFIHVDKRQEYLHRELSALAVEYPNVRMAQERHSTIWGGASLLTMHLQCMRELIAMTDWHWDYFINLSESDFPVKSVEDLTAYLTKYKGKNFLKSHGTNTPRFIRKQGLDKLFHECDTHMWRLGPRHIIANIRMDGGSDWFGLHRDFIDNVVLAGEDNELTTGLKKFWANALLPSESFFHTLLVNSEMCDTIVNNNLHLTNWRRKQGCKCQYKHIVDWCGCSPNDFLATDIGKLLAQEERPIFFARKFEAIINQEIIHYVHTYLFGPYPDGAVALSSYWQNEYHHNDGGRLEDIARTAYSALVRGAGRTVLRSTPGDAENGAQGASCPPRIIPHRLLEVTLYNNDDKFEGLLMLFEASQPSNRNKTFQVETMFVPEEIYEVRGLMGPTARLVHLEVGTNFDPKEELFRNMARIIGPFSEVVLRHEWAEGPKVQISVVYIDSANQVAASYDVTVNAEDRILSHKPEFLLPLRPGLWKVKVLYLWEEVAETGFIVLPMTHIYGKRISPEQAHDINNGPDNGSYVKASFRDVESTLHLVNTDELRKRSLANGRLIGEKLDSFVDTLMMKIWRIGESCIVGEELGACGKLPQCKSRDWSSRAPDPKSKLFGIDEKTGYMIQAR